MAGIVDVGRLVATLGLNSTPFVAGMNKAKSSMAELSKYAMITGRTLTRFVTLPMALAGGAAINTQKKFEASMTKIIGLVGVSRKQVEAWNKEVLKMSQVTGRGPEELADALYFVTSAGIRGAYAMEVLEMSAKASAAGLGETKVVADLVTSAMNAYGKENLSAAQATDILVASVREGKAEANELAGAMGMVLPIASEFGVTFDQVGAAFAGMTRTGTNARVAATQLKAILSAMASPSKQAQDALAEYSMSAEDFRKTVRDEGLIKALLDMREATEGNESALSEIFPNIRALMGVLDLLGANMQYNVQIFEALTNAGGSLERAFAEIEGTTQQKLNVALATFKTTLIGIGEVMKPLVVGVLAKLIDKLKEISSSFQAMTAQQRKVKLATLAVTAALGPFLIIVSKAIPMFVALGGAITAALGPFGILFAALVGGALALGRYVSKQNEVLKITKRSKKVTDDLNVTIATETMRLSTLTARLASVTKGTEEWNIIKDKINTTYGKYLENLLSEKMSTDELTEAMGKLSAARLRDVKIKGLTAEMDRLMEENANIYAKGMNVLMDKIEEGNDALVAKGKVFPMEEFATAMQVAIDAGVDVMEKGGTWTEDVRDIGEKMYAEWFYGMTSTASMSKEARNDFLQIFYNMTSGTIDMNKALGPIEAQIAASTIKEKEVNVKVKLERIDEQVQWTKDSEKTEGRKATLIALIGLEKDRNLLLDKESAAINNEKIKLYEDELKELKKIASSLGDEMAKKGEISKLEKEREKLSGKKAIANDAAIAKAQEELKIIQLETSALSEIERQRGMIEIARENTLRMDKASLELANKTIALNYRDLQLLELESSGLSDIEKRKKKQRINDEYSVYLSKEAYKAHLKTYRLEEQSIRLAELKAAGANQLLIWQNELNDLIENQQFGDVDTGRIAELEGLIKLEEALQKGYNREQELLIEIANEEEKLKTLTGEAAENTRISIGYKKLEVIELQLQNGLLTDIEIVQLKIAQIEIKRAMTTNPALTAELNEQLKLYKEQLESLEKQEDYNTGETAPKQYSMKWFKETFASLKRLKDEGMVVGEAFREQFNEIMTVIAEGIAYHAENILGVMTDMVSAVSNVIEAQKQKELSAAGSNAKKREAIEKKYYEKQKKWAVVQATISMFVGIAKSVELGWPMMLVGMALAAIAGAATIAAINAQNFAQGGLVYGETLARVGEYPGASGNPEVIAPLDRLKGLLGNTGKRNEKVIFEIEGRTLVGVLQKEETLMNSY